jgi:hypothetical protein
MIMGGSTEGKLDHPTQGANRADATAHHEHSGPGGKVLNVEGTRINGKDESQPPGAGSAGDEDSGD